MDYSNKHVVSLHWLHTEFTNRALKNINVLTSNPIIPICLEHCRLIKTMKNFPSGSNEQPRTSGRYCSGGIQREV